MASRGRKVSLLDALVSSGVDFSGKTRRQCSEILDKLFSERNIAPNGSSKSLGMPALHWAIRSGYDGLTDALLERGVWTRLKDSLSWSPLEVAFDYNNIHAFKSLIAKDPSISFVDDFEGRDPMMRAIAENKLGFLEACLDAEMDVMRQDNDGLTALMMTASDPRIDTIYTARILHLSMRGLDPSDGRIRLKNLMECRDSRGQTALARAVLSGNIPVFQLLVNEGADVNTTDKSMRSPLLLSVVSNRIEFTRALIERGANVNAKTINGVTPLGHAVAKGRTDFVDLLLSSGADPNISDKGSRPLIYACVSGRLDLVDKLLVHGADPNCSDSNQDDFTPLIYAVKSGNIKLVNRLLSAGAKVDIPDSQGITPLMHATSVCGDSSEYRAIIDVLLDGGADPHRRHDLGLSALDIAQKSELTDVYSRYCTIVNTKRLEAAFGEIGSGAVLDDLYGGGLNAAIDLHEKLGSGLLPEELINSVAKHQVGQIVRRHVDEQNSTIYNSLFGAIKYAQSLPLAGAAGFTYYSGGSLEEAVALGGAALVAYLANTTYEEKSKIHNAALGIAISIRLTYDNIVDGISDAARSLWCRAITLSDRLLAFTSSLFGSKSDVSRSLDKMSKTISSSYGDEDASSEFSETSKISIDSLVESVDKNGVEFGRVLKIDDFVAPFHRSVSRTSRHSTPRSDSDSLSL